MMMQWMKASEVARELAVSTSYAYKLIHQLNNELESERIPHHSRPDSRQYLYERLYGGKQKEASEHARLQG